MILIGITGGVGAGKSEVLRFISETYHAQVLLADELANEIKEPGMRCYEPILRCLGREILAEDGTIDKQRMAKVIFADQEKLKQVNEIIHPAVREEIMKRIEDARKEEKVDFFFLEAALLIEEHYDEVVDELWYIFAKKEVRRARLRESRGYSDEKIDAIMKKQLSDEIYRKTCGFVIDNSGTFEETKRQIETKMEEYPCVRQM